MQMQIKIVQIPENMNHWGDSIKKDTGQITGVWLFDAATVHHCCELTPSYRLRFLYFKTENEVDDVVYDELIGYDDFYMHCNKVKEFKIKDVNFVPDEDEEYEDNFQKAVEQYTANHMV